MEDKDTPKATGKNWLIMKGIVLCVEGYVYDDIDKTNTGIVILQALTMMGVVKSDELMSIINFVCFAHGNLVLHKEVDPVALCKYLDERKESINPILIEYIDMTHNMISVAIDRAKKEGHDGSDAE